VRAASTRRGQFVWKRRPLTHLDQWSENILVARLRKRHIIRVRFVLLRVPSHNFSEEWHEPYRCYPRRCFWAGSREGDDGCLWFGRCQNQRTQSAGSQRNGGQTNTGTTCHCWRAKSHEARKRSFASRSALNTGTRGRGSSSHRLRGKRLEVLG